MSEKTQTQWTLGDEVTAPNTGEELIQVPIAQGYKGKIMGFWLSSTDPLGNVLKLNWKSDGVAKSQMIVLGGIGTVFVTTETAFNDTDPADPMSNVTVTTTTAGMAGSKYQASLLIKEVP